MPSRCPSTNFSEVKPPISAQTVLDFRPNRFRVRLSGGPLQKRLLERPIHGHPVFLILVLEPAG